MDTFTASGLIKNEAQRLGFAACGICRPGFTGTHAAYLTEWLKNGYQAEMDFMSRNLEKRSDSRLLVENAQSIIITALNYYPVRKQSPVAAQIACYAYGKDYHVVVKEKLRALVDYINRDISPVNARIFCDTAPLLEKHHAVKAGLGWIGKNTQLIIPEKGSFVFLGAILLDIPLQYNEVEVEDRCGNCTRCMDACPTKALVGPGQLNANRCLSYLTIEHKGELPEFYTEKIDNRIYGCDVCNDVCPWNKQAKGNDIQDFQPSDALLSLTFEQVKHLDEAGFDKLFAHSPVHRIGLKQLKRNMQHQLQFKIQKATLPDCALIQDLASKVWEPTYGAILSPEQLHYMFEWMYSVQSLENQMKSGHTFFVLYEGDNPAGYASIEKETPERYHLQKIYVLPIHQGKGFGLKLLKNAEQYIRELQPEGSVALALNVNRENKARYFYEKQGFTVESEGDFDIGNGYFMNDYIMVKAL